MPRTCTENGCSRPASHRRTDDRSVKLCLQHAEAFIQEWGGHPTQLEPMEA